MKLIYRIKLIVLLLAAIFVTGCSIQKQAKYQKILYPKYEFRGAWLSTAWQSRFTSMTPSEIETYLTNMVDSLHQIGFNALIFQVRPCADAFYNSSYEPWSQFLTGAQGVAPANHFDPLAFLIKECHHRNMELHAWLNPYRVTLSANQTLAKNNLYFREPDRFVKYDNKIYFNPGLAKNRKFICDVVKDILLHYDVDGIHLDDYFYPYPVKGKEFPDLATFSELRTKQGFKQNQRDAWRRDNVNRLIRDIKQTIHTTKPWVRFGISPFGIYKNAKEYKGGSKTFGLQAYSALYSDIKLWMQKRWIDYVIPQLYWPIDYKPADYKVLVQWWAKNAHSTPLYIGQDVRRTMDAQGKDGMKSQLDEKLIRQRLEKNISGICCWNAYDIFDNYKNINQQLEKVYFRYPALIPPYKNLKKRRPDNVENLTLKKIGEKQYRLSWDARIDAEDPLAAKHFVIYQFMKGEKLRLDIADNIIGQTGNCYFDLPIQTQVNGSTFVVTSTDSFHNESKGSRIKVNF